MTQNNEMPKEIWAHYETYKPETHVGSYFDCQVCSTLAQKYIRADLVPQWMPKEDFEKDGQEVIAWLSSNKGFEDITAKLFYSDGWYWSESEEPVKRPDLIKGVQPWPQPPKGQDDDS